MAERRTWRRQQTAMVERRLLRRKRVKLTLAERVGKGRGDGKAKKNANK
jgi:hypothetical protein